MLERVELDDLQLQVLASLSDAVRHGNAPLINALRELLGLLDQLRGGLPLPATSKDAA